MAGMMDFLFGRDALKKAVTSSTGEDEDEVKKRKKKAAESTSVPVNASDAAATAQAKLKQEALKKVVKGRTAKGSY